MYKRITTFLLAMAMVLVLGPAQSFAEDGAARTMAEKKWAVTATVDGDVTLIKWEADGDYEPADDLTFVVRNGNTDIAKLWKELPEEAGDDDAEYAFDEEENKYSFEAEGIEEGDTVTIISSDEETGDCTAVGKSDANEEQPEYEEKTFSISKAGPQFKEVTAKNITKTSVVLEWSFEEGYEPTGKEKFTVRCGSIEKKNITAYEQKMTGLKPHTAYNFEVILQGTDPEVSGKVRVETEKDTPSSITFKSRVAAYDSSIRRFPVTLRWSFNSSYVPNGKEKYTLKYFPVDAKGRRAGKTTKLNVSGRKKVFKFKEGKNYKFTVTVTGYGDEGDSFTSKAFILKVPYKKPGNVTGLTSMSTFNGVFLSWKPVSDAEGYYIRWTGSDGSKGGKKIAGRKNTSNILIPIAYENVPIEYTYSVKAVRKNTAKSAKAAVIKDQAVRTMFYNFTFSENRQLHSYTGGEVWTNFYAGESYVAKGYEAGRYMFYYGGRQYFVNRLSTWNAGINGGVGTNIYTTAEAESFINRLGVSSSTSYLIWVNTHTQREYIFSWYSGAWHCIRGPIMVSTGAPRTPTATGATRISRRIRYDGEPWWNVCNYFSLHGMAPGWTLGHPASNGCVRQSDEDAHYIYNLPLYTRVYVF